MYFQKLCKNKKKETGHSTQNSNTLSFGDIYWHKVNAITLHIFKILRFFIETCNTHFLTFSVELLENYKLDFPGFHICLTPNCLLSRCYKIIKKYLITYTLLAIKFTTFTSESTEKPKMYFQKLRKNYQKEIGHSTQFGYLVFW